MIYEKGQKLRYLPDSRLEQPLEVEVIALRKGGCAKLSNGRVADVDGISEGSKSAPGGRVEVLA